jgi:uncharacterized protein YdbL (DUF1318 family)
LTSAENQKRLQNEFSCAVVETNAREAEIQKLAKQLRVTDKEIQELEAKKQKLEQDFFRKEKAYVKLC